MMIGASLHNPTRWAIWSGFRIWMAWVASHLPLCVAIFIFASLVLGLGWEFEGPIVAFGTCHWLGVSCIPLVPLRPSPIPFVRRLRAWGIWPGSPLPLWESGWLLLPPLQHPHLWPHSQGLLRVTVWLLPHPVMVRAAITWVICWFRLAIPTTGLVVTMALVLTQSQVSSFSLSRQLSWAGNTIHQGCYIGTRWSHRYVYHPMEEVIPEVLLGL